MIKENGGAPAKILVTGATGRIGKILVSDLLERGFLVRATTSKEPPSEYNSNRALEWRRFDFATDTDYDGVVENCDAVLHLAAEIGKLERMNRVNAEATKLLAMASERARTKVFLYISTVSVYGSGLSPIMTEDSPVLSTHEDKPSEYWALDYVRCYGRTKLEGELSIRQAAKAVAYVVLRPAVVVDIADILGIRDWSIVKRTLAAHRHAHHIFVRDVTDAIIWFMNRALAGVPAPGSVETYNLAEDDSPAPTHAAFMKEAFKISGDPRFRVVTAPWILDWLRDFLRFRTLPLRNPLWRMRFPNDRLRAAGYRFKFGMVKANSLALETLREERRGLDLG